MYFSPPSSHNSSKQILGVKLVSEVTHNDVFIVIHPRILIITFRGSVDIFNKGCPPFMRFDNFLTFLLSIRI